jgi:hypothetical protein
VVLGQAETRHTCSVDPEQQVAGADAETRQLLAKVGRRAWLTVLLGLASAAAGTVIRSRGLGTGAIRLLLSGVSGVALVTGVGEALAKFRWKRILVRYPWRLLEWRVLKVRRYPIRSRRTVVLFGAGDVYTVGYMAKWSRLPIAASDEVLVAGTQGRNQVVRLEGASTFLTIRPPLTALSRRRWLAATMETTPRSAHRTASGPTGSSTATSAL